MAIHRRTEKRGGGGHTETYDMRFVLYTAVLSSAAPFRRTPCVT